jgi:hypothetical protein
VALSFVSAATEAHFRLIEKRQGLSLVLEQIEGFEPLQTAPLAALSMDGRPIDASTGGIKGQRPSKKDKLRAAATRGQ